MIYKHLLNAAWLYLQEPHHMNNNCIIIAIYISAKSQSTELIFLYKTQHGVRFKRYSNADWIQNLSPVRLISCPQAVELIQGAVKGHRARNKNMSRMRGYLAEEDSEPELSHSVGYKPRQAPARCV